MTVLDVITDGADADEVLRLAGAVEDASEHPVGQAIARAAAARLGALPPAEHFTALPGAGVRGTVGGREITVGRPDLFARLGLTVPAPLGRAAEDAEAHGRTAVLAGWDGQARAALVVADQLKPHAAAAVARIRRLGIRPLLVTGDNEHAARSVADELGIPAADVLAGVKPEGKVEAVRDLQAGGTAVALVGDGVNDAAALAQADLGMAVGTGADAAIGAADLTLVGGDPLSIVMADRAGPGHHGGDPRQPGLGVRLQPGRDPAGRARLPQPAVRRRRDVGQLADRRRQQPAAAPLPPPRSEGAGPCVTCSAPSPAR